MIVFIKRLIAKRRLARIQEAQAIAYAAYRGAHEAYNAAYGRKDSRRKGERLPALKAAMNAKLLSEMIAR